VRCAEESIVRRNKALAKPQRVFAAFWEDAMSDKKKVENKAAVVSGPERCKFEDCKKSSSKFGFCAEHYEMYMAGVIRGDGKKPIDYSQKLSNWQKSQRKVA
jgi:hypothetical protein